MEIGKYYQSPKGTIVQYIGYGVANDCFKGKVIVSGEDLRFKKGFISGYFNKKRFRLIKNYKEHQELWK